MDPVYLREIEQLREILLAGPEGSRILKILVFGSQVKGSAGPGSDVDVLIVGADGKRVREAVAEALLQVQLSGQAPIETVTVSVEDLFTSRDLFLRQVLETGRELYSKTEAEIRREGGWAYARLAGQYLESSREAAGRGHLRLGLDGAYNAAELAVKGFLLLAGLTDLPSSHGGLVQVFAQQYIKPGLLSAELGRSLNRALDLRNGARYRYDFALTLADAQVVLDLAQTLLNELESRLGETE